MVSTPLRPFRDEDMIMGRSTAAGNVTATEYTEPTVVRDATGRSHLVGPMGTMDEVEQQRRELDEAARAEGVEPGTGRQEQGEGEQSSPGKNSSESETTDSKQNEKNESGSTTATPEGTSSPKNDASGNSAGTTAGATGRATGSKTTK